VSITIVEGDTTSGSPYDIKMVEDNVLLYIDEVLIMSMTVNTKCRECQSTDLVQFLNLGLQPLANAFLTRAQLDYQEPKYPLEAYICSQCNLAQLIHVVDKSEIFRHYVYFSSAMPKVSAHWKKYADQVSQHFLENSQDFVLEIGSNDGVLLRHFKQLGYRVLGVDPATNIAEIATAGGLPTLPEFFTAALASQIYEKNGLPKVILANNVFAHIDDHLDLLSGIKTLLHSDGVFIFEAPYLIDMFENLSYDTIYHEHLSFLSLRPLVRFLAQYGLEIFEVQIVPSQGQSIRVFSGHQGKHTIENSVQNLIDQELKCKLDQVDTYFDLAAKVAASKERLVTCLSEVKSQGKKIAAYGAPAKGNTLLNYCQIGAQILDFAVDDLPSKQGLYTPGMHIPVTSREEVDRASPDYLLLLAWNYSEAVMEKEKNFLNKGGKLIIPIGAAGSTLRSIP
jgi:2-polyprenyl-3-methyl-5-hydroxy-6-metoxy-1,4-benzoquinol methylase